MRRSVVVVVVAMGVAGTFGCPKGSDTAVPIAGAVEVASIQAQPPYMPFWVTPDTAVVLRRGHGSAPDVFLVIGARTRTQRPGAALAPGVADLVIGAQLVAWRADGRQLVVARGKLGGPVREYVALDAAGRVLTRWKPLSAGRRTRGIAFLGASGTWVAVETIDHQAEVVVRKVGVGGPVRHAVAPVDMTALLGVAEPGTAVLGPGRCLEGVSTARVCRYSLSAMAMRGAAVDLPRPGGMLAAGWELYPSHDGRHWLHCVDRHSEDRSRSPRALYVGDWSGHVRPLGMWTVRRGTPGPERFSWVPGDRAIGFVHNRRLYRAPVAERP